MCCFLVKLDVVVRFAADVCFRRLFLSSLSKRELVLLTLENGRVEKKKKKHLLHSCFLKVRVLVCLRESLWWPFNL